MDHNQSAIWLESLKKERTAAKNWQAKYLTEEQQRQLSEDEEMLATEAKMRKLGTGRISEREAMERRLANLEGEDPADAPLPPSQYTLQRERIAAQVASERQRSHLMTRKTDTGSLLADIGPGLWVSVNPGYVCPTRRTMTSSQAHAHVFDAAKGWADPCDKTHHLKQEEMMKHADKCLQLNEKPFVSGGMKLSAGK